MSASMLVLDLIRSHYRHDEQAFRAFALRLARGAKNVDTQRTMLDVINAGERRPAPGAPPPRRFDNPQKVESSKSELLEPLSNVSFDDLLLNADLRAQLEEIVIELAHQSELSERGLRPRSRLLFEGPRRVVMGQILAAKAAASEELEDIEA